MLYVEIKGITKRFGMQTVLNNVAGPAEACVELLVPGSAPCVVGASAGWRTQPPRKLERGGGEGCAASLLMVEWSHARTPSGTPSVVLLQGFAPRGAVSQPRRAAPL